MVNVLRVFHLLELTLACFCFLKNLFEFRFCHIFSPFFCSGGAIASQGLSECGDETNFGVVCRSWKNDLLNVMSLRFGFQILKLPSSCPPTLAIASHEPHSLCDASQLLGHV